MRNVFLALLVLFFLAAAPTATFAQQVGACDGKAVAASVPRGTLVALKRAADNGDYEEVVRIAQVEPALKVASICRSKGGEILGYLIVNRNGCLVASKTPPVR